jgi:hypothetical protein
MVNWKTTLGGAITALGLFLSNQDNATLKLIGNILGPLGAFLIGLVAKDRNVTGGNTKNIV